MTDSILANVLLSSPFLTLQPILCPFRSGSWCFYVSLNMLGVCCLNGPFLLFLFFFNHCGLQVKNTHNSVNFCMNHIPYICIFEFLFVSFVFLLLTIVGSVGHCYGSFCPFCIMLTTQTMWAVETRNSVSLCYPQAIWGGGCLVLVNRCIGHGLCGAI